jgi:uncharacterized protein involved in type VI secretion and phage assembly
MSLCETQSSDYRASQVARYHGKFRGMVVNNVDPERRGRIQATVSDVSGILPTTWIMPCAPLSGQGMGTFFVPPIGTGVWIEFEQGDPDFPIYTGGFWGEGSELPSEAYEGSLLSPNIVVKTMLQNSLVLSDLPGTGGIVLKSRSGAKIEITDTGILIDNGQKATIQLTGNTVSINGTALVVT